jgi:hypothetical protein
MILSDVLYSAIGLKGLRNTTINFGSRSRNFNLQQAAYKMLTHSLARAAGNPSQKHVCVVCVCVCVCVCVGMGRWV